MTIPQQTPDLQIDRMNPEELRALLQLSTVFKNYWAAVEKKVSEEQERRARMKVLRLPLNRVDQKDKRK